MGRETKKRKFEWESNEYIYPRKDYSEAAPPWGMRVMCSMWMERPSTLGKEIVIMMWLLIVAVLGLALPLLALVLVDNRHMKEEGQNGHHHGGHAAFVWRR